LRIKESDRLTVTVNALKQLASDLKGSYLGTTQNFDQQKFNVELQDNGGTRSANDADPGMANDSNTTYNDIYQIPLFLFSLLLLIVIFDLYYLL
jgi:hypothetical protein